MLVDSADEEMCLVFIDHFIFKGLAESPFPSVAVVVSPSAVSLPHVIEKWGFDEWDAG